MQDVQKVPSAKADGNILSQEITKSVIVRYEAIQSILFLDCFVPSHGVVSRLRRAKSKAPALRAANNQLFILKYWITRLEPCF
jgi:hypothetical protein